MAHIDLRPPEPVVRRFLTPQLLYARYGKRVLDLAVCLALLPVVVPIVALVWALVRRAGAPGFFAHDRVGRNGRMFR